MKVLLFTALGVGAGAAHAVTLLRVVRTLERRLDLLVVRLLVVGGALTAAAVCGQLWATSLAWFVTFILTLFILALPRSAPR